MRRDKVTIWPEDLHIVQIKVYKSINRNILINLIIITCHIEQVAIIEIVEIITIEIVEIIIIEIVVNIIIETVVITIRELMVNIIIELVVILGRIDCRKVMIN